MIDWTAFTWEAFATLFTGMLAVGGAVYVGTRQAEISDRQSRILEDQTKLELLKLRSDLFDRRFEVYEASSRFLAEILSHADEPEAEFRINFLKALDTSRFLFSPQVSANLDALWKESCDFFATKHMMKANFNQSGHYGDGMPDREFRQLTALNERFVNLRELFGEELKLSESAPAGGDS